MEVPTPPIRKTSTCLTLLPSRCPDLTTFCRLDELGLEVDRAAPRAGSGGAGLPGRRARRVVPPLRLRGRRRGTP